MTQHTRPWYVLDALTDDYKVVAEHGGDFRMLKLLKIVRSIIVSVGIIGITIFSLLSTTANPTIVTLFGLTTLGLYNGIEVADYAALATAFSEVKSQQSSDDG